jgi:hypothetical protein
MIQLGTILPKLPDITSVLAHKSQNEHQESAGRLVWALRLTCETLFKHATKRWIGVQTLGG